MNRYPCSIALAVAFCGLTVSAPAAAQQDPARFDAIARDAAARFEETRRAAEPQTRPTIAPAPAAAAVDVTLDQATERALERNLDLAVERLNPRTFDFSIAA